MARKRQKVEELNKRVADEMAKQEKNPTEQNGSKKTESGLEAKTPQVQTQSYIPDYTAPTKQAQQSSKGNVKMFSINKPNIDTGYPKNSLFDNAPGKWTFDPNNPTKWNKDQTWGQQKQAAAQI